MRYLPWEGKIRRDWNKEEEEEEEQGESDQRRVVPFLGYEDKMAAQKTVISSLQKRGTAVE
eukprot:3758103-Ditylum_brightwellii.AAC.1